MNVAVHVPRHDEVAAVRRELAGDGGLPVRERLHPVGLVRLHVLLLDLGPAEHVHPLAAVVGPEGQHVVLLVRVVGGEHLVHDVEVLRLGGVAVLRGVNVGRRRHRGDGRRRHRRAGRPTLSPMPICAAIVSVSKNIHSSVIRPSSLYVAKFAPLKPERLAGRLATRRVLVVLAGHHVHSETASLPCQRMREKASLRSLDCSKLSLKCFSSSALPLTS